MSLFGCRNWRRRISRALDGREPTLASLSAHLLRCEGCRNYAEATEEDLFRLEQALSPLNRATWVAEGVGLPVQAAPRLPGLLPAWAPSALGFTLAAGVLGALVLGSGPFAFCWGALGVLPEPVDFGMAVLLVTTLFGGAVLLKERRSLEAWSRALVPAMTAAGVLCVAGGVFIYGAYWDLTCAVWNSTI